MQTHNEKPNRDDYVCKKVWEMLNEHQHKPGTGYVHLWGLKSALGYWAVWEVP